MSPARPKLRRLRAPETDWSSVEAQSHANQGSVSERDALPTTGVAKPAATAPGRRGGRVVEGARLESVYTGNRIAGSNPALSAKNLITPMNSIA